MQLTLTLSHPLTLTLSTHQVVDDPAVKASLQKQMLQLVQRPVPEYNKVERELYGSSSNPVVVSSDSEDALEGMVINALEEEAKEDDTTTLDDDNANIEDSDDGEAPETEEGVNPVAEGNTASMWVNQVTVNPNP